MFFLTSFITPDSTEPGWDTLQALSANTAATVSVSSERLVTEFLLGNSDVGCSYSKQGSSCFNRANKSHVGSRCYFFPSTGGSTFFASHSSLFHVLSSAAKIGHDPLRSEQTAA